MGLQIWIPCDGRNNLGLTGKIAFSSGSGVTYADGKTGQCLSYNGNGSNIGSIDYTLGNAVTMACWVYYTSRPASGKNDWCFQLGTSAGFVNTVLGIVTYPDNISIAIGGLYHQYPYTLSTGVWYHFAVTWDGSVATFYINGTKEAEFTDLNTGTKKVATAMALGSNVANTSTTRLRGKLNDVRVYDYCLSPYEVKELSKALILHYKLDSIDGRIVQEGHNIIEYTYLQSDGYSYINSGVIPTTATEFEMKYSINALTYETVFFGCSTKPYYRDGSNYSLDMRAGGQLLYTFKENGFDVSDYNASSNNPFVVKLSGNKFYINNTEYNANRASTHPSVPIYLFIRNVAGSSSGISSAGRLYYCKFWEGSTLIRDFVPVSYDGTLGLFDKVNMQFYPNAGSGSFTAGPAVSETVSDSSGYNRAGTVHGRLFESEDTRRFDTCAVFDSSTYITAGKEAKVKDQITVAGWVKPSAWTSSMGNFISCTEIGGFNFEVNDNGDLQFPVGTGTSSNTYKVAVFQTPLSQFSEGWHHLAGTFDGYTVKVYLDGVLDGSTVAYTTKTPIFYNSSNGIFLAAEAASSEVTPYNSSFTGSLSDIRIYATALSAEDIMDLYHTSTIVDNAGSLHSFQLKEKSANILTIEKINKWARSSTYYTYYTTRNDVLSFPIQPNWYPSTSPVYATLRDEFKENTSYLIDMWIDADSVVYDNVNRPAGFIVVYSDGTTKDLTRTGNAQSPVGWQHVLFVTPADKTISYIRVFYYTSAAFYVRADSFITEASSTEIEADGSTSSGQFIENTDAAFIGKGDFNASKFIEI